jgi:hypothetical protein
MRDRSPPTGGDELPEVGGRAGDHSATKLRELRLELGVGRNYRGDSGTYEMQEFASDHVHLG